MAVDVNDATKPLDNNAANPASEGAGELRALKDKINKLYSSLGVDATWPKLIDTARGFNFDISDASIADLQTSKFKITRTANAAGKNTWGMFAEVALSNNVSVTTGFIGALSAYATIGTGCTFTAAYALNVGIYQQSATNPTGQCLGIFVNFANRLTVGAAAPGGVGANQYNNSSIGIFIGAFPRSSSGEYCGWKTGIKFATDSMDRDINGPGYCIDLSAIRVVGSVDPMLNFPMKAGIKLAHMMGIIWDTADTIISYYDNNTNRFTLRSGVTERWGVDMTNGSVYKNAVFQY
jgi:hypothetical protein